MLITTEMFNCDKVVKMNLIGSKTDMHCVCYSCTSTSKPEHFWIFLKDGTSVQTGIVFTFVQRIISKYSVKTWTNFHMESP